MSAFPAWTISLLRRGWQVLVVVGMLVLLFTALVLTRPSADAAGPYRVPHDPRIEDRLGIRVERAAVVADGGIVEIRYTVLDGQKASRFQNDTHHPPVLRSERRRGDVYRAALMKQGHDLRPGQTYYILYLNNGGAIRSGDTIDIDAGGIHLQHVPVR